MAFGQGGTVLTPLGLANAYATFANGGKRFTPEVAAAVVSSKGKLVQLLRAEGLPGNVVAAPVGARPDPPGAARAS